MHQTHFLIFQLLQWRLRAGGHTKVYKIGATYYAEKDDGSLLLSSGTFDTVLQTALNQRGLVTIDQPGNFDMSNTSAIALNLSHTTLQMGPNTKNQAQAAHTGYVFGIGSATEIVKNTWIIGGQIEKATTNKNWTGIRIYSNDDNGVCIGGLINTYINFPFRGVLLDTQGTGWNPGETLRNLWIDKPTIGFDFNNTSTKGFGRSCLMPARTRPSGKP